MIVIFLILGGFIVKCVLDVDITNSSCEIVSFRTFAQYASAGVLELIFEFKGLVGFFQKKKDE